MDVMTFSELMEISEFTYKQVEEIRVIMKRKVQASQMTSNQYKLINKYISTRRIES